jgi:ubiquinol-cytochrome c reductase cytochrome c1 subunit
MATEPPGMRPGAARAARALGRVAAALTVAALAAAGLAPPPAAAAEEAGGGYGADWESWRADTTVADAASVQRGARYFVSYCLGCHSLKYERWSRLGEDLGIPPDVLAKQLLPPGDKPADYITSAMPEADAENWFGKAPPDLSLMARARGKDYLFRYLMTYYVDPTRETGANNLALPSTAMPDVLSEIEGLKKAVYRQVEKPGANGAVTHEQVFDHFETIAPGRLTQAQFEQFARDLVNFLDYVGEPNQLLRRALGVWVVLFLLVFTWLTWRVKREYWKDVH